MKFDPIQIAFDKLEPSIINTAREHVEGRNILIYCLARGAKRTETEIVQWLRAQGPHVKDLDKFKIKDVFKSDTD